MGSVRLGVDDQRRIAGLNWKSDAQFFANAYGRFSTGDIISLSGETGPDILVGSANLRPLAGITLVALDGDGYLRQFTLGGQWKPTSGVLKEISLRLRNNDFDKLFPGRDAWVVDAGASAEWRDLGVEGDSLSLRPAYTFNIAKQGRYRYHRPQGAIDYRYPLAENWRLVGGLTVAYRDYDGAYAGTGEHREDWYFVPRAQVIKTNFLRPNLTVTGYYQFQRNISNDDTFDYDNHVIGGNLIWSF